MNLEFKNRKRMSNSSSKDKLASPLIILFFSWMARMVLWVLLPRWPLLPRLLLLPGLFLLPRLLPLTAMSVQLSVQPLVFNYCLFLFLEFTHQHLNALLPQEVVVFIIDFITVLDLPLQYLCGVKAVLLNLLQGVFENVGCKKAHFGG